MNSQYLPPYHAMKINGIWSVINDVGKIDAACDCRCSAEDLAREMTSYANRMHGVDLYDPDNHRSTTETRTDEQIHRDFIDGLATSQCIRDLNYSPNSKEEA